LIVVARVVSDKLPQAADGVFKKTSLRIDGLPDNEFKNFRSVSSV